MELDNERHAVPQDDVSAKGDQGGIRTRQAAGTEMKMCAADSADGGVL